MPKNSCRLRGTPNVNFPFKMSACVLTPLTQVALGVLCVLFLDPVWAENKIRGHWGAVSVSDYSYEAVITHTTFDEKVFVKTNCSEAVPGVFSGFYLQSFSLLCFASLWIAWNLDTRTDCEFRGEHYLLLLIVNQSWALLWTLSLSSFIEPPLWCSFFLVDVSIAYLLQLYFKSALTAFMAIKNLEANLKKRKRYWDSYALLVNSSGVECCRV